MSKSDPNKDKNQDDIFDPTSTQRPKFNSPTSFTPVLVEHFVEFGSQEETPNCTTGASLPTIKEESEDEDDHAESESLQVLCHRSPSSVANILDTDGDGLIELERFFDLSLTNEDLGRSTISPLIPLPSSPPTPPTSPLVSHISGQGTIVSSKNQVDPNTLRTPHDLDTSPDRWASQKLPEWTSILDDLQDIAVREERVEEFDIHLRYAKDNWDEDEVLSWERYIHRQMWTLEEFPGPPPILHTFISLRFEQHMRHRLEMTRGIVASHNDAFPKRQKDLMTEVRRRHADDVQDIFTELRQEYDLLDVKEKQGFAGFGTREQGKDIASEWYPAKNSQQGARATRHDDETSEKSESSDSTKSVDNRDEINKQEDQEDNQKKSTTAKGKQTATPEESAQIEVERRLLEENSLPMAEYAKRQHEKELDEKIEQEEEEEKLAALREIVREIDHQTHLIEALARGEGPAPKDSDEQLVADTVW